jgi:hypothetical protein
MTEFTGIFDAKVDEIITSVASLPLGRSLIGYATLTLLAMPSDDSPPQTCVACGERASAPRMFVRAIACRSKHIYDDDGRAFVSSGTDGITLHIDVDEMSIVPALHSLRQLGALAAEAASAADQGPISYKIGYRECR